MPEPDLARAAAGSRPALHFTTTRGWINDPYGVTWHDGRYHLFFQHIPDQVAWRADQHWGHAVSADLLHWTEEPVALTPDATDAGLWSGCVVRTPDGDAWLFYSTVDVADPGISRIRVARPTDASWRAWRKGEVVAEVPPGLELRDFRDPFVLRDGDLWRMVVGAGTTDGTGLALGWTSTDLTTWSYDGVVAARGTEERDPVWTGSVWECPQLFALDAAWVLVVSVWSEGETQYVAAAVGDLVDGRFEARTWQRLTYGPGHYAASTFVDAEGRRCLIHWVRDVVDPAGAWAGAHSVPHVLTLDGDRLRLAPHPRVAAAVEPLGVAERRTVGDAELTVADGVVRVEQGGTSFTMPADGGPLGLLVDGPVVEVFGPAGVAGFGLRPPGGSAD